MIAVKEFSLMELLYRVHRQAADVIEETEFRCQVEGCGLPIRGHPRCRACTILIGPAHIETESHDGYCWSCRQAIERRKARRIRPWRYYE